MNNQPIGKLEINEHLMSSFQALDASPAATVEQWESLAMEYFQAGYPLNAGTCFMRADAIKDRPAPTPKRTRRPRMVAVGV